MDVDGSILHRERRPTPQAKGYAAILSNIQELVLDLEQRAGKPCRVGVGMPGAISVETGLHRNSNTVCLNGMPVKHDLETLLQRKIRIANDANCFALSEALDGAGRGYGVVFGVILGTGVGGGIVYNGRLHEGAQHIAGEWGHNVLEPDGPPCYCGKRGCVETFLSGPGLVRDYAAHASANAGRSQPPASRDTRPSLDVAGAGCTEAAEAAGGEPARDARAIAQAAAGGDRLAQAAVQRYCDRFGRALSFVVNILDPDVIVLGGGLSHIAQLYTRGRESLALYSFTKGFHTALLPHRHGDSSGVRGAARLWPNED